MTRRPLTAALGLVLAAPLLLLAPPASAATPAKPYDFDGDGLPDLVAGARGLEVDGNVLTGGVVVLPGARSGPSSSGVVVPEPLDPSGESVFGTSLASADFDRDGFADLAVGSPGESGRYQPSGFVRILYGTRTGLGTGRVTKLSQAGGEQFDAGFGRTLAAADFDGDGWPDLAAGAPLTTEQDATPATGTVSVYQGGPDGFSANRATVLHADRSSTRYDVGYGSALAVGDLDGNGRPDLVVGASDTASPFPGSVSSCLGTSGGLTGCTQLDRDSQLNGITALAVGNIEGNAKPEIVAGVPGNLRAPASAGRLEVISQAGGGRYTSGAVERFSLTQDSPGVPGSDEDGDRFGQDVALGDLDGNGYADLVVGAPGEDVGSTKDAGRVTVLYGTQDGIRTSGNLTYDRGTKSVAGSVGKGDEFGDAVSLADRDGDSHLDLGVGAPGDVDGSGAVTQLRGSGSGFTGSGSKTVTLTTLRYRTPDGAVLGGVLGS